MLTRHLMKGFSRAIVLLLLLLGAAVAFTKEPDGWMATRRGLAGKDLNAVYFADTKRGWIAGDGGFLSHTNDGGRTWIQQPAGITEAINDIYFRGKEDGYLLAGNRILGTRDGGETWHELQRFPAADYDGATPELYSVRFSSRKKGWVVGSISRRDKVVDSFVIYTDDGGETWQRQRVPTRSELVHLAFVNEEQGWIVGASGTILHTDDGGETWTRQRSNTAVMLYHVDFRNRSTGWAVGARGAILRTTDGGESWIPVPVPVQATLLSIQFVDEDQGWIVGRGGVILRSDDGGRTWLQQESRTKQNLYALFVNKKSGWAVGGDGIVLQYER